MDSANRDPGIQSAMKPKSVAHNIAESNQIGVDLLITDIRTALTLLDLADTTSVSENRVRRIQEAVHAHETIVGFLKRLKPTPEQSATLNHMLPILEHRLKALGVLD